MYETIKINIFKSKLNKKGGHPCKMIHEILSNYFDFMYLAMYN